MACSCLRARAVALKSELLPVLEDLLDQSTAQNAAVRQWYNDVDAGGCRLMITLVQHDLVHEAAYLYSSHRAIGLTCFGGRAHKGRSSGYAQCPMADDPWLQTLHAANCHADLVSSPLEQRWHG